MLKFIVNERTVETDCPSGMAALDFIREQLRLTGTKEGCKEGECGACTILVGELQEKDNFVKYHTAASCLVPIGALNGKHVVTVEGVNFKNELNLVQQLIFKNNASQCGFCTPGIVLSLIGFLLTTEDYSYKDAVNALDGNICRCTGYYPIRNAAKELSSCFTSESKDFRKRADLLVAKNVLPEYFKNISAKLSVTDKKSVNENSSNLVAGATDLFVQRPDSLYNDKLNFLSDIENLNYIKEVKNIIAVGANITVEEFRKSEIINRYFPSMKEDLLLVSSTLMRNKATLTGNIVNASPIGDLTIILLALDAELILSKEGIERKIKLCNFYSGYKKFDLKCREIITEIQIPIPSAGCKFSFEKVSNRKYLDIASCNTAMLAEVSNGIVKKLNVSAGGVAPMPILLSKSASELINKKLDAANIENFINKVESEIKPIDDIRGSAEYKNLLTKQLIKAHFKKLFGSKVERLEVI